MRIARPSLARSALPHPTFRPARAPPVNAPVPSSSTADPSSGTSGSVGAKRYRVFLSYSHADTKWARWLMRRLEGWRVPRRFYGRAAPIGEVGKRIAPVFRDRDELPTTSDLGETIRAALRESATLVVICSPTAAKSRWVKEEILAFKRRHGERRVFGFIVSGEPKAEGTDADCFSPALRAELGADGELSTRPAEIVAADARAQGDGKEAALVRLLAGLLGVGFDELRQREQARRLRRMTWIAAGSAVGMAAMLGLAVTAWRARNAEVEARDDARRRQESGEELIAFMLDDLKTGLQKSEKLDTLDQTGARVMAYFQSLNPRDLTDNTLAQQAKALTQIGQIRIAQARYPEAMGAVATAYTRAAALAERHPRDGDRLFERAQAEYWVGVVHYRRGELKEAAAWFTRYRESAFALVALEGPGARATREVAYGQNNLAIIKLEQRDLDGARAGFLAERESRFKLSQQKPGDLTLRFDLSTVDSWLGIVAERSGDFAEALACSARRTDQLRELVALDSGTATWKNRFADALNFQAVALTLVGRQDEAAQLFQQSREVFETLLAQDPKNLSRRSLVVNVRLKQAGLLLAKGQHAAAADLLEGAKAQLEPLVSVKMPLPQNVVMMAVVWRLKAQLLVATESSAAVAAGARSIELLSRLVNEGRPDDRTLREYALARIVSGKIARAEGRLAVAREEWGKALAAVFPLVANSKDWRILDAAARALVLLGRADESKAIIARLEEAGYRPLEPWENSSEGTFVSPPTTTIPKTN